MGYKKIFLCLGYFWLLAGIACLLCAGLELSARIYYGIRLSFLPEAPARHFYLAGREFDPAADAAYERESTECQNYEWAPYVYWGLRAYSGQYIDIEQDGTRRTSNLFSPRNARVKIFMFGGSAMWGFGVRDQYTIPSIVSRLLRDSGYTGFTVTNFGQLAFVSTQEYIKLLLELRRGNIPDIVVFYDGVNDILSALKNNSSGVTLNEESRRREFNELQPRNDSRSMSDVQRILRILQRHSAFVRLCYGLKDKIRHFAFHQHDAEGTRDAGRCTEALADGIVADYLFAMHMIELCAKEFQFEAYFFLQPTVFSKRQHAPEEAEYGSVHMFGERVEACFRKVYAKLSSRINNPDFYDLQQIFTTRDPVFIDFCHVRESGNQLIAENIVEKLRRSAKLAGK